MNKYYNYWNSIILATQKSIDECDDPLSRELAHMDLDDFTDRLIGQL